MVAMEDLPHNLQEFSELPTAPFSWAYCIMENVTDQNLVCTAENNHGADEAGDTVDWKRQSRWDEGGMEAIRGYGE